MSLFRFVCMRTMPKKDDKYYYLSLTKDKIITLMTCVRDDAEYDRVRLSEGACFRKEKHAKLAYGFLLKYLRENKDELGIISAEPKENETVWTINLLNLNGRPYTIEYSSTEIKDKYLFNHHQLFKSADYARKAPKKIIQKLREESRRNSFNSILDFIADGEEVFYPDITSSTGWKHIVYNSKNPKHFNLFRDGLLFYSSTRAKIACNAMKRKINPEVKKFSVED